MRLRVGRVRCLPLLLLFISHALSAQSTFSDGFEGCLSACAAPLSCPSSEPGEACIAGRFFDVETAAPICSPQAGTAACTAIELGGPCALEVRVYDALQFITNPVSAPPIPATETLIDGCGRFRISGFDVPATGAALSIDDASGAPDLHVMAADVHPVSSGAELEQTRMHAVRRTTNQAWTSTAGFPFGGNTFAEVGTYAAIFLHNGTPKAGVQVLSDGALVPSEDYYFSDPTPTRRSSVDAALTSTGINGSALFTTSMISVVGGAGGEPVGCVWPGVQGGSTPGVVVVHEFSAEIDGQPGVPCN